MKLQIGSNIIDTKLIRH